MAAKPLSQLSPAYRRRIERGLAQGKSRQAARGKQSGEHVIRRQREARAAEAFGSLTTSQRAYARKIGREFGGRAGDDDPDESAAEAVSHMQLVGYEAFRGEVALQRAAHRQWLAEVKAKTYASRGPGLLDMWAARDNAFPNPRWYFYH